MSIFDRTVPNDNLKNFVKGSLIHQVLNLEEFPNMIKTYRNDKANYIKLALNKPKFYNYINMASSLNSLSYRLDFFLVKAKESVDFMYSFKIKNDLKGTYNLFLIIKDKDRLYSSVFLYDSKVEREAEEEKTKKLSEKK